MATSRGKAAVMRYMKDAPEALRERVLRGAARAAGAVVATKAKELSISSEVSDKIKVRTKREDGKIIARVQVLMGNYNLPLWLEYGTDPHFISVSDSQRRGQGIRRINSKVREEGGNASLVIGGNFVGETVFHPGARAHPFLRPALDMEEADAIRAAQAFISARVMPSGITGSDQGDEP
ncbi:HK97 gp10 family phage protein [Sphingomonas sp. VDB2]|uniref:HK97 gp10 family phage protein n=1 Tax=Sphingomonas sp. VDB2 TaxID=3228751 RepID=UPI003A810AAB